MSLRIHWDNLTYEQARRALLWINDKLAVLPLPAQLRSLRVESLDLGDQAPDIELLDVCSPDSEVVYSGKLARVSSPYPTKSLGLSDLFAVPGPTPSASTATGFSSPSLAYPQRRSDSPLSTPRTPRRRGSFAASATSTPIGRRGSIVASTTSTPIGRRGFSTPRADASPSAGIFASSSASFLASPLAPQPNRAPLPPIMLRVRVRYAGDAACVLEAFVWQQFPGGGGIGIPITLTGASLRVDAVVCVIFTSSRILVYLEKDPQIDLDIDTRIGNPAVKVLQVDQVERLVLDQLRALVAKTLVHPNIQTVHEFS